MGFQNTCLPSLKPRSITPVLLAKAITQIQCSCDSSGTRATIKHCNHNKLAVTLVSLACCFRLDAKQENLHLSQLEMLEICIKRPVRNDTCCVRKQFGLLVSLSSVLIAWLITHMFMRKLLENCRGSHIAVGDQCCL